MIKNRRLKFGIAAFSVSLVQVFLPNSDITPTIISLSWLLNWLGLILISEHITKKLSGKSLLKTIRSSRSNTINFIIASVLGGALVEGIGQWLGKLWFYPYFSTPEYIVVCIPGFALYMLMIGECYLAFKAIVDTLIKPRKVSKRYYPIEPKLYRFLGGVGCIAILAGVTLLLRDYVNGYNFRVNAPYDLHVTFAAILLLALGVWWCSEYVEYRHRETSLLKDIIRSYWNPIIAIILATALVGVSMELINLRHGYWVYANWPLQNTHILGLPVIVIALAWPLHFIMFLSLFRAVTARDSAEVWKVPTLNKRKSRHHKNILIKKYS